MREVPDGDTLGRFRHILEENGIQQKLFAQVVQHLMEKGLILKKGTIVDSTIIEAPSSIKNKGKERDPDAHQVKKGISSGNQRTGSLMNDSLTTESSVSAVWGTNIPYFSTKS